jgi:hypothetical protein
VPPLAGRRPGARRFAAALFELGGDALARGARVVTGRAAGADAAVAPPGGPSAGEASPQKPSGASEAARAAAAEEAAARLDAARERLRATIAPPAEEDLPADDPSAAP